VAAIASAAPDPTRSTFVSRSYSGLSRSPTSTCGAAGSERQHPHQGREGCLTRAAARDMGLQRPADGLDLPGILAAAADGRIAVFVCVWIGPFEHRRSDRLGTGAISASMSDRFQDIAPSPLAGARPCRASLPDLRGEGRHLHQLCWPHPTVAPLSSQRPTTNRATERSSAGCSAWSVRPAARSSRKRCSRKSPLRFPAYQGVTLARVGALGWQLPSEVEATATT